MKKNLQDRQRPEASDWGQTQKCSKVKHFLDHTITML